MILLKIQMLRGMADQKQMRSITNIHVKNVKWFAHNCISYLQFQFPVFNFSVRYSVWRVSYKVMIWNQVVLLFFIFKFDVICIFSSFIFDYFESIFSDRKSCLTLEGSLISRTKHDSPLWKQWSYKKCKHCVFLVCSLEN